MWKNLEAQHYPGPCEGIVRLWNLPSCRVESHLFLSLRYCLTLRSSGHPAGLQRKCYCRMFHSTHGIMSRLLIVASRYGNSGRLRPPWCSRLLRGVDTELYLGAPARGFSQVRHGGGAAFLISRGGQQPSSDQEADFENSTRGGSAARSCHQICLLELRVRLLCMLV
jgi:hypothetical protein